jgi:hypothetical protein
MDNPGGFEETIREDEDSKESGVCKKRGIIACC